MFNLKKEDMWKNDREEFLNSTLVQLKQLGSQIGYDADQGNIHAKDIIQYYTRLHRSFDPVFHDMLKQSLHLYTTGKH